MTKSILSTAARRFWRKTFLICAVACLLPQSARSSNDSHSADISIVLGTWTGTSICVGTRPACKNEEVVYRFQAAKAGSEVVTLLADKIIDGVRVPMGKMDFQYKEADKSLTCEFKIRQTHGIWSFTIDGDTMNGTLVILPDRSLGRRVSVHRVSDDKVPKAPAIEEYGSLLPSAGDPGLNEIRVARAKPLPRVKRITGGGGA
jgi:hypothetical protein